MKLWNNPVTMPKSLFTLPAKDDRLRSLPVRLAASDPHCQIGLRAGRPVSSGEFVMRMAAWSALLGQQSGTRFALYLADVMEFGAALLGAWLAGKTIWLSPDTLDATCAALAVEVDGFLGDFPECHKPLRPFRHIASPLVGQRLAPGQEALVVFTSGSTGGRQAIPKKLYQLENEVETLEATFGFAIGDASIVATVSHQHIYGLLFKLLWPLCSGRAIRAEPVAYPRSLTLLAAPCVLVTTPAFLNHLPPDLVAPALRLVFSSGGALSAVTARTCMGTLGSAPIEVYGSSETGGIAWRRLDGMGEVPLCAFAGVHWRIDAGLLSIRSSYLRDEAWLTLQDRAIAAADGFLLLGRSDRIVKIAEVRVSLDVIEAALLSTGLVKELRIVPRDVPGGRQMLAAFVVPLATIADAGEQAALTACLRIALAAVVPAVAVPRQWHYFDHMPTNAQGKITPAVLLAMVREL